MVVDPRGILLMHFAVQTSSYTESEPATDNVVHRHAILPCARKRVDLWQHPMLEKV